MRNGQKCKSEKQLILQTCQDLDLETGQLSFSGTKGTKDSLKKTCDVARWHSQCTGTQLPPSMSLHPISQGTSPQLACPQYSAHHNRRAQAAHIGSSLQLYRGKCAAGPHRRPPTQSHFSKIDKCNQPT